jgi:hypothetical protein
MALFTSVLEHEIEVNRGSSPWRPFPSRPCFKLIMRQGIQCMSWNYPARYRMETTPLLSKSYMVTPLSLSLSLSLPCRVVGRSNSFCSEL